MVRPWLQVDADACLSTRERSGPFERKSGMTGAWSGVTNYATTREDDYLATKRSQEGWELKHGRWER